MLIGKHPLALPLYAGALPAGVTINCTGWRRYVVLTGVAEAGAELVRREADARGAHLVDDRVEPFVNCACGQALDFSPGDNWHCDVMALDLPPPHIWKLKDLADFFNGTVFWVYKRTEQAAEDLPPRIPCMSRLRYDTHSPTFQAWMRRQIGHDEDAEEP